MKTRTFFKGISPYLPFVILFLLLTALSFDAVSQNINVGNLDTSITGWMKNVYSWAKWVVGIVLVLGLAWCVYAVATNHPKAKEHVISFIAALALVGIAWSIVGNLT